MRPATVRAWLSRRERPRLLVVRNDGLGDLVLTLPLLAALRRSLPSAHLTVLMAESLLPLVPLLADVDAAIADPGVLLKRHAGSFLPHEVAARQEALRADLRAGAYDAALLPYAESATARLVRRAGIPVRVGPLRRAFFWHFNAWYTRSRRGSDAPEYALNLGYLECLGLPEEYAAPRLALPPDALTAAQRPAGPYAVLHAHKRSGTALTWPLERFAALARGFAGAGLDVVAVGDAPDRPVLDAALGGLPRLRIETTLTLPQLVAVIAGARVFVGNSSGPLHLAALAGTPHVALYPQDRVSAPERWRTLPLPYAPADFRRYLLASRFPKGCVQCEGERCEYFNCVASLPLDAVWSALRAWDGALPQRGPVAAPGDPR